MVGHHGLEQAYAQTMMDLGELEELEELLGVELAVASKRSVKVAVTFLETNRLTKMTLAAPVVLP